ncbi:4-hydroxyphenylpyruvate dioxygenase [Merismopedia glauca]|uniref:4-hydroxyphenylpyruvate dioxygenase n=1 Tax=Merismopedia glauca CCAP 1448/3 TaxID=1296344 RepID=A0A2T1C2T4_9CYAN|nr:4-hydroxyphenylpyruvate dioxygenase [Merismopedia glauca]PSB02457.1 4-hydroxyphenylpyruvate dioxygenase [Merismopedia glauca CCAP 1448/3]
MKDFCPIESFDHLEFYVGNAKQAAIFYSKCFGFTQTAYRGLETGSRDIASYVLEQGKIRLIFTSSLTPDNAIAKSVSLHGDSIAVMGLEVADAFSAYKETIARGAKGAIAPTEVEDGYGIFRYAAIQGYGDLLIKFVDHSDYRGVFAPGYQNLASPTPGFGLKQIDHVVGNVELGQMDYWVKYLAETMGFSLLVHFDDKTISTKNSALASKVMQDKSRKIKLPINEPALGKGKSQIQEYLDYHRGAGIQHVALATDDIISTVTQLRNAGAEFLYTPPTYYERLTERVGTINEPIAELAKLGILVDRDSEGYLLQIFTQPVQDRPTVFFEIIQRHGANGFGEGNFKSLFAAIEREQEQRGNL